MGEYSGTSGYLIEKTFARMCREFLADLERWKPDRLNKGGYSTPRTDVPPERMPKQYRGLQREPIQGWMEELRGSGVVEPTDQELEASLFLEELMDAGKAEDDIIFALEDAQELMRRIKPPVEREIVWAGCVGGHGKPPRGTVLLGYEPSTIYPPISDSAVGEGFFFTYPMPNDRDGLRFQAYYEKLNRWGLFDTPGDAEEYLKAYLSFVPPDWDQHCFNYRITEVREAC
jgi:hypothetical protein